MKITDMKIEVVKRELPATGLDSDLGRFAGTTEQGVLRVFTDEGIEGNCFVGEFRHGGRGEFDAILKTLKPEMLGRDPSERAGWGAKCLRSNRPAHGIRRVHLGAASGISSDPSGDGTGLGYR